VHQDGLVHISALANTFVKDPRSVVKPGDVVKVKVLEVDKARKRISLTMRMDDAASESRRDTSSSQSAGQDHARKLKDQSGRRRADQDDGALAEALRRAGLRTSGGSRK
jgi:uncharacterized protein